MFFFWSMRRLINKINDIASIDQRDNNGLTRRQKRDGRGGYSDACSLRMTFVEPWQDRKPGMRSDKGLINHTFLLWGHIQTQSNTLTQRHHIAMHHCNVCIIRKDWLSGNIKEILVWKKHFWRVYTETHLNQPAYRNMDNKQRSIDKV